MISHARLVKTVMRHRTASLRRGDMLIEVMLAITIFSFVAVLSLSMMNSGVAGGERALELSTARSELDAQAEALRFIYSSYLTEHSLSASCLTNSPTELCQHYASVWHRITENAVSQAQYDSDSGIPYPLSSCSIVYDDNAKKLYDNYAFVLNTRMLDIFSINTSSNQVVNVNYLYISSRHNRTAFKEAPLGARLVFKNSSNTTESTDKLSNLSSDYRYLAGAEGIWIVAVKSGSGEYYDFYIQSCWNDPKSTVPTSLDTIVRLYNPDA